MNQDMPATTTELSHHHHVPFYRAVSWGAIFAGSVAAMAIQLLLTLLGTGIGLGAFNPLSDPDPLKNFSIGSAIIWSVCALISLYFGGYVAGFFSTKANRKSGCMHGMMVWSVIMVVSFLLLSMGAGMAVGGAVKVVGEGLGFGAKAVAAGTGEMAKEGMQQGKDQISSFLDEAVQSRSTNSTPGSGVRARREIGFAVAKLFAPENENRMADNRTALVQALTQYGDMSQADASKMVEDWTNSYNNLKEELKSAKDAAARKAREAADAAARNLAWASVIAFVAFLLGASMTTIGGHCGAACACRACDTRTTVETSQTRV